MANGKRLIDADKLIEALPIVTEDKQISLYGAVADFMVMISEMPTVDAVEVVHGRWENVQETEMYVPDMKLTITKTAETCSECKARIGFVGAKQYLFDTLCPNCGARMDENA